MCVKHHGLHLYVHTEHKIIATVILFYHTSLMLTVLMLRIKNSTHLSNKDAKRRGKNFGHCWCVSSWDTKNVLILRPQNEQIMRESSLFTRCWSEFLLCDCCDDR